MRPKEGGRDRQTLGLLYRRPSGCGLYDNGVVSDSQLEGGCIYAHFHERATVVIFVGLQFRFSMSEMEDLVKRGFWVNWDHGRLFGATITLDGEWANLVVAGAIVVALFAATQIWEILIFLLHQLRATGTPADGLFWQQQVLLR